jgi:hypothetical protein
MDDQHRHVCAPRRTLDCVTDASDWRLTGQHKYLTGVTLRLRKWWASRPPAEGGELDHDHCDFCWRHFGDHVFEDDPDTQLEGLATDNGSHWICRECFEDFKDRFGWVVEGELPAL